MTNLNPPLTKPLPKIPKSLLYLFIAVALLGFLDATYLTASHYSQGIVPCAIGQCETVLSSKYSAIASVPISLPGAIYYLIIFLLGMSYLDSQSEKSLRLAALFTWAGFLTSLFLVYLQLFVINAICLYCMGSAITSTLLFIFGLKILNKLKISA